MKKLLKSGILFGILYELQYNIRVIPLAKKIMNSMGNYPKISDSTPMRY